MRKLGVVIIGVGGAVASTVIAGVALMNRRLTPRIGMLTEGDPILDVVPLDALVFGGWDVHGLDIYRAASLHRILPPELLAQVREEIESVQPWPGIFSARHVGRLVADQALEVESYREQIAAVERQVAAFRDAHGIHDLVMINLASTEGHIDLSAVHQTLDAFEAGLDANDPAISPSMRYLYAANTMRLPYCSFAPCAFVPALAEQALATGNPIAGADGKTGQTLVKTALAAMFRLRRLIVEGWYSTNFLGNHDGFTLDDVSSNKAKVLSKLSVLDSILGYHVENHQVHIHYYKPRGDAKEAWDNIDIVGFAGVPMQMKINFLCQDSVLAAPLVIDLVRLLDLARRHSAAGVQSQLSLFFKSPFTNGAPQIHDLFRQEALLLEWLEAHGRAPLKAGEMAAGL